MSTRSMLAAGAATLLVLAFAGTLGGQVYLWTDAAGKGHETRRFRDVPADRVASMRCRTEVTRILSGERFEVTGGHTIRLAGIDVPAASLSWNPSVAGKAQRRLAELIRGKTVELSFDRNFKNAAFDTLAFVTTAEGVLVNETLLKEGLAAWHCGPGTDRLSMRFRQAAEGARKAEIGLWKKTDTAATPRPRPQKIRGFSLGLYSRDPNFDYGPLLREQKDIGATDILLITPWFLDHFTACTIVPKKHRTTPLAGVARTIRQARALGLRVAVMPIVLLWKPDSDHWRGNIKPRDLDDWFLSYQEFIGAFASLCEQSGAQELIVGSEFSSLEQHEKHWRRVILSVRSRFRGCLSYSANWDHLNVIKFWDSLDAIGMTGYHSLTESDDPTIEELTAAWGRIRGELEKSLASYKKPYFFSEMGYASLDGINKDPWDYVSPQTPDNKEQADCYEAWFRAWQKPQARFRGAFFYTWWRNNDQDDRRQYTVWKKPAFDVIRRWYKKAR